MRRTAEVVLTIIGAFVYLLGVIFGGLLNFIFGTEEFQNEILNDPAINELNQQEAQFALDFVGSMGTAVIVVSVISIIAGIIAMFLFKGDNKPKVAGIILLIVGVITTLISFGGAIFASVFYIIAGIMGLVRKKKPEDEDETFASVQ